MSKVNLKFYLKPQTHDAAKYLKFQSFYDENRSDPNPQTADIKSLTGAENLGLQCLQLKAKVYQLMHINP